MALTGTATADLGLGDMLSQQRQNETEEERKRRMAQQRAQQQFGLAGSPATQMLFGASGGGVGRAY